MSTEKIELTPSQLDRLAKVEAVTSEQVDAAIRITEEKFASYSIDFRMPLIGAIIQALATNHLAEVTRISAPK